MNKTVSTAAMITLIAATNLNMNAEKATATEYREQPVNQAVAEYAVFIDGSWQFGLTADDVQDIQDAIVGRASGPATSYDAFRKELGL